MGGSLPEMGDCYRVPGLDRSPTQLAEAERRRGDADNPRFLRGDYRALPFSDGSFDAVLTLFSSLGYLERDEDIGVLRELRRVLRPGRALIVETAHRDAMAKSAQPHSWDIFPTDRCTWKSADGTDRQGPSRPPG